MKFRLIDLLFIPYVIIALPIASLFYFAIALTNFDIIITIAGAVILWLIMIPYPTYKYVKKRIIS